MKHKRKLSFLLALSLGVTPIVTSINQSKSYAKEIEKNNSKLEKDLVKAFKKFDSSIIRNSKNEIVSVDVDVLEKKFGKSAFFDELRTAVKQKSNPYMSRSYLNCMLGAIRDAFGANFIYELSKHGIYELIKAKAWGTLAKLMVNIASKTGIKMLGVHALVGLLGYYAIRCLF